MSNIRYATDAKLPLT